MSRTQWLITIPGTSSSKYLYINIESKDDATPGFYTITGTLVQING